MSRIAQLEAAIDAIGRPATTSLALQAIVRSRAEKQAWDAAHPAEAREYFRLCALLETEVTRAERERVEIDRAERALRSMGAKLERSGIGQRALEAVEKPQDTEALGAVKRWLPDAALNWLVLCGAPGTGKSVAATWAVRETIRSGSGAAFRRTQSLAKLSAFDVGQAEFEALKHVGLLVVDDFGAELLTEYARAQIFELLDWRHENYGRTIVTSNLPWAELKTRLGERLVDRIGQSGRLSQLSAGKSMRKRGFSVEEK